MTVLSRLTARLDKTDTCWIWKGYRTKFGYGMIRVDGTAKLTHRVSYELHTGPIPNGLHVLHHCDNPPCCNPDHLYVGTNADNIRDKLSRNREARGAKCRAHNPIYGERSSNSKLTEANVIYIREQAALGVSSGVLAKQFGIHVVTASRIAKGIRWSRTDGPTRGNLTRKECGLRSAKARWNFTQPSDAEETAELI